MVSTVDSFHGRTFNTLSVTGNEANVRRFPPSLGQSQFVPFGDVAALEKALDEEVAALILEPVQGEGGVRIPDTSYLVEAGRLCRQRGVLLIVDEVQTGFGRTGKLFAIEHAAGKVEPDFLTMGKGIAGGFPFAGFAVTGEVVSRIEKGDHGGTYCGNPLGCAVAAAVVEYLVREDIPRQVAGKGQLLVSGLQKLARKFPDLIADVRGIGLMTALELTDDGQVADLTLACQQRGLLVTPTRNAIVRLIPDLLVSEAHIHQALGMLDAAFSTMAPRVAAAS